MTKKWIQRFNDAVDGLKKLGISVKNSSATYQGRPMYFVSLERQVFPYKLLTLEGVQEFYQKGKYDSLK